MFGTVIRHFGTENIDNKIAINAINMLRLSLVENEGIKYLGYDQLKDLKRMCKDLESLVDEQIKAWDEWLSTPSEPSTEEERNV